MQNLNRIPLSCLRAVEVVARRGSVTAAAEELGVTPGAVSQQVVRAELALGLGLFDRTGRGMLPTERGREVSDLLTQGFGRLAAAVDRARPDAARTLTVSVAPVFAARWLIWRLPQFQAAHPGLRVRLDASLALADPSRGEADLCIRVGRGKWPRVDAQKLFDQIIFPVAAPQVASRINVHADLARVPVIVEPKADFSWQDWLLPEGHAGISLGTGPEFSDAALCLDAAISRAGVFLAFETLTFDALARGSVVAPFAGRHRTGNSYWLVAARDRRPTPAMRAFGDWLKAEIAAAGLGNTDGS
ncbi:MAG: LysR family transcriptional regulator [Rhodobacterales bacterium]|nr:MAG: LysR family transcriptional regulator [Rhodobacterales bacterium]